MKSKKKELVNHPSHYNSGKIEAIEYIKDLGIAEDFCVGNAIKYIARAGRKDEKLNIQDLNKASWYINREIERLSNLSDNKIS